MNKRYLIAAAVVSCVLISCSLFTLKITDVTVTKFIAAHQNLTAEKLVHTDAEIVDGKELEPFNKAVAKAGFSDYFEYIAVEQRISVAYALIAAEKSVRSESGNGDNKTADALLMQAVKKMPDRDTLAAVKRHEQELAAIFLKHQ